MPTFAAACSSPPLLLAAQRRPSTTTATTSFLLKRLVSNPRRRRLVVAAASFDDGKAHSPNFKKSGLSSLIQDIEPLDVSIIQKDVSADTVDAMKRTISGMLGLLPSDQFHVLIEAFWEPLSRLLVSSMMTGYTLRNAEYRLCLQRNLDIYEGHSGEQRQGNATHSHGALLDGSAKIFDFSGRNESLPNSIKIDGDLSFEKMDDLGLGEMTPEAQQYIFRLQSHISSAKNELREIKRKNAALHVQHFVGEEKNDLLDYLRSLEPEKVAELAELTSTELQETIHSTVHGLLATLSPKMHFKSSAPLPESEAAAAAVKLIKEEDRADVVDNSSSLQFQPLVSVSRDYLARLIFWCMLLGHYLKGLEYRLGLQQMLTLSGDAVVHDGGPPVS